MTTFLLWALLTGVLYCWLPTLLLVRGARRNPDVRALRERAVAAFVIASGGSVFWIAAFNAWAGYNWWDLQTTQIIARGVFLLVLGIPSSYWLILYYRGRWGE